MAKAFQSDPRSRYVERLHSAYRRGLLNIFVGAGISQESGFAGWKTLNQELMRQYLAHEIGTTTPAGMLASPNIEVTASELYETLGRDAMADFVSRATRGRFARLLANVLYNGRNVEDVPLKSVHYQIASLSQKAKLFTLNFDPLLERGLARMFPTRDWVSFRSPSQDGTSLGGKYRVEHLHGWIDADGRMSQSGVILTESDYLELIGNPDARPNKTLARMLGGPSTTLILGMSLSDPNFRRVLYFLNKQRRSTRERIYVVMRRESKPALDYYAELHWVSKGLRLLFVKQHDDIPGLLRDIQWGEAAADELPHWVWESASWRQGHLPNDAIFTNPWQMGAYKSLSALSAKIRSLFGVLNEERIEIGLFIPFLDSKTNARLRMIASSRKFVPPDRALFRAERRVLTIRKGQEQGIAGVCYSTGTSRAVAFGEGDVDINFTSAMSGTWVSDKGYRDWRSIVAVPIIDTKHWIPVAVITLTSSMPNPFWNDFGSKQNLLEPELYAAMRSAAYFCIVDLLPSLVKGIK